MHQQIEKMAESQRAINDGYKHDLQQLKTKLSAVETRCDGAETRAGRAESMVNILMLSNKFDDGEPPHMGDVPAGV
jgi:hypothetical protein